MQFWTNPDYKKSCLSRLALSIDDNTPFDDFTDGINKGFVKRSALFEFSNSVTLYSPLLFGLSQVEKLIFPNQAITISMQHDSDERRICSAATLGQFSLEVQDIEMHIVRYWLSADMVNAAYQELDRIGFQTFFWKRLSVQGPFAAQANQSQLSVMIGANMRMPITVFAAFVESEAFTGTFTKNAYNYVTLPISYSVCKFGSTTSPIQSGYTPDYSISSYQLSYEYSTFIQSIAGSVNPPFGTIEYDKWVSGLHFYAYPMSSQAASNSYLQEDSEPKDNLTLHYQFSQPLDKSYVLLVYVVTQSCAKFYSSNVWQISHIAGNP